MASVLGHMTVTRQYITRNLNPESSRSSFAPRRRPSRVMSEQSERPQWAAEHTQTKEHEQGGVTYHWYYQVPPSVIHTQGPASLRFEVRRYRQTSVC